MTYTPAVMHGKGIGDALGAPFEQPSSATEPPARLIGWTGEFLDTHGAYGEFKAGQWTDDTGMAVALAEALLEGKGFDPKIVMRRYFQWYETVPLQLVGGTIKKAMESYRLGWLNVSKCGVEGSEGNGTAMRCASIGLYYWRDYEMAMQMARADAALTHRSLEAEEGSAAVAGMVACLVAREPIPDSLLRVDTFLRPSRIRGGIKGLYDLRESGYTDLQALLKHFGTKGHVLQTVPAAFACFLLTTSYEEAVLAAIRAGGDADTTAAITGALSGAWYGYEGIPERYKKGVDRGEYLHSLDEQLFAVGRGRVGISSAS